VLKKNCQHNVLMDEGGSSQLQTDMKEQERQCMCNITLRRIHAAEKQHI